jgi:superfamily II DNA or RNA helicase
VSLSVRTPAYVTLDGLTPVQVESCRRFLTFSDKGVQYLLTRHKQNRWFKANEPEKWLARLEELKAQQKRCLLFESVGKPQLEECGQYFTYSGLKQDLMAHLRIDVSETLVEYPDPKPMAWASPPHMLRPYQVEAAYLCEQHKHCAISLPTGSGKSRVLMELCKRYGLPTIIMAPTKSIAGQLYRDMVKHLGKKYVGMYGDGKKELTKLFTVCIAASLTRVDEDSPAWKWFSTCKVFIADESHMCPADTLEQVCMGVSRLAPYRWFFSATQTRNDGSQMVLKGITGPVVMDLTLKDLVDQGYLAKPLFRMMKVPSNSSFSSMDVQKMTRKHLFCNPDVLRMAAKVANSVIKEHGHRVLILVDEVSQFPLLQPLLKYESRFAHGGVTKENRGTLSPDYWKSDPTDLVARFDNGEFPILVGTGVISMGTDVKSPETVIFLRGGSSVIDIPQSVGRGTRLFTFPDGRQKKSFNFVDFDVHLNDDKYSDSSEWEEDAEISPLHRHALARARMCEKLYPGTMKRM